MASIEELNQLNPTDPSQDPEITAAAALTRFAWGESRAAAYDNYFSLMEQRGFSREEAMATLWELNSVRRSGYDENGDEAG